MLIEVGETFQVKEKEIVDFQQKLLEDKLYNEEEVSDSFIIVGLCFQYYRICIYRFLCVYGYFYKGIVYDWIVVL